MPDRPAPPPCLIVFGALRSGTTMLRLMLDAHPGLACPGEHDFLFDHLHPAEGGWRYDARALAADRIFRASGLALPDAPGDGAAALAGLVAAIGGDDGRRDGGRDGGRRPVLMLHRNLAAARALLPGAPILHVLRDPRDVARSTLKINMAGHVYFGIDHWLRTETEWDRHGPRDPSPGAASDSPAPAVMTLRYEDLVAAPAAALAGVCRLAGLDYDPAMLRYDGTSTYDPPDAALATQWRRRLSPRQVRLVESKVRPLLAPRGYGESGLPPLTPSRPERAALWLADRWGVWRGMIRRYGPLRPLQRGLARRLGLRGLERRAQAAIDEMTVRHLK